MPAQPSANALTYEALRFAWRQVESRGGKPGGDGVSLARFAQRIDANLIALLDEATGGDYSPGPVRVALVQTDAKLRRISILSVRDRVLQRAVLDLLTPALDRRFLPCSFGYRPRRSLHDAIARIVHLRDDGHPWVIDADIRDCFGSLNHDRLSALIREAVPDPVLQRLLLAWLIYPTAGPLRRPTGAGIPLGAPISPLFCNLYLHELDQSLRRRSLKLVRYADDFVVLCKSEAHAEYALNKVEKVVAGLDLALHPAKTRITTFEAGFDFLGVHFEGDDYAYEVDGKRIVIDHLPPEDFHYHADGYA